MKTLLPLLFLAAAVVGNPLPAGDPSLLAKPDDLQALDAAEAVIRAYNAKDEGRRRRKREDHAEHGHTSDGSCAFGYDDFVKYAYGCNGGDCAQEQPVAS